MKELIKKIAEFFLPFRVNHPPKKAFEIPSTVRISGRKFSIGDKVIVISNEEDPYEVGEIIGYDLIGIHRNYLPVIKFNNEEEPTICFAHLEPYSLELCLELDKLRPIEQWNYTTHQHCQIKEKYGVKYKTFKCMCDECTIRRNTIKEKRK